jgi:hypothetical protein
MLTDPEQRVLRAVLNAEEALAGQRAPELGDIIDATMDLGRVERQEAIDSLRIKDLLVKSLRFVAGGQDAEAYYVPEHKLALAELAHDPEAERLAKVRVEPGPRERLSDLAGPS